MASPRSISVSAISRTWDVADEFGRGTQTLPKSFVETRWTEYHAPLDPVAAPPRSCHIVLHCGDSSFVCRAVAWRLESDRSWTSCAAE